MKILIFNEVRLTDKPLFDSYLSQPERRGSECAFSNLFVWRDCYHIYWCRYLDFLLVRVKRKDVDFFLQPFGGRDEDLPQVLEAIKDYEGHSFEMHGIYEDTKERFARVLPGLEFTEDRDNWDYVYLQEKLATLSGRKLHGQKNHYNAFCKAYPQHVYEPITEQNLSECMSFAAAWCDWRALDDPSIGEERLAIHQGLENFAALGLRGGLIRIDGRVQAFSFGSKINEDTAVLHVEKANPAVRGLYTAICKEFAHNAWADVKYLNREEDMGHEGLRTAKLALHPEFMVQKYNLLY